VLLVIIIITAAVGREVERRARGERGRERSSVFWRVGDSGVVGGGIASQKGGKGGSEKKAFKGRRKLGIRNLLRREFREKVLQRERKSCHALARGDGSIRPLKGKTRPANGESSMEGGGSASRDCHWLKKGTIRPGEAKAH